MKNKGNTMGNFSTIQKIIDNAIALDLANPNFAISDKEKLLRDSAIMLGCLDYYRTFPMRIIYLTTYDASSNAVATFDWAGLPTPKKENGTMYIPFDDILTGGSPKVPTEQLDHAHFLGIMKVERPYWSNYSNPSMWEKSMFGFQVSGGTNNYDIMSNLLSNTLDELSTGQPYYTINRMQNRVELFVPWGFGQLALSCCIGFDSPEYVEMSKVDFLCKFISYRFIESIIQARDGVKFDADFDLSTDALKTRLEKLKEETDSIKNHTPLHLALWA